MNEIFSEICQSSGLQISDFTFETESKEYSACHFQINGHTFISRTAKTTPKKLGQFVTFWKRNREGLTQPFTEQDNFHFYIINVETENRIGLFIFPKSILIAKGIVATEKKDGKRGFRVYPIWVTVTNKQAEKTQQWQLDYFYEIDRITDFKKHKNKYHNNHVINQLIHFTNLKTSR